MLMNMKSVSMTVSFTLSMDQSSEKPSGNEIPRMNESKEKTPPVMYPRSESSKDNLKEDDDDIIYVKGSDSESDGDDSVIFIEDVPRQTSDGRSVSPDFFDRETPPISPRRFYRMDVRSVAPDFFDRKTPPVSPQKLCRIDYIKDVPSDFCVQKTPPVSPPIKIRIQQSSSTTVQYQQHTSSKKPRVDCSKSLGAPSKARSVCKTVEIRLKRVDESIIQQYERTSKVSKFACSQDSSFEGGTKKKQMTKEPIKRKSLQHTKTDLLPQQALNPCDQQLHQKAISSTGESLSLQDTQLMRVTMDVPYSKILELENHEKRKENISECSKINKDLGSSVIHVAKSKGRKVSLSEHHMPSQNATKKHSNTESVGHNEKERNKKESGKTHPAHKQMHTARKKESNDNVCLEKNYSKSDRNKVRCELCTKRVSNLVDHIIIAHGEQLA